MGAIFNRQLRMKVILMKVLLMIAVVNDMLFTEQLKDRSVFVDGFIKFSNVRKRYKMGEIYVYALAGVDFVINKGEFVVVAGPSGAGKSTVLNILGGMDTCDDGEITVDGSRVDKYNREKLIEYRRYDIGFVFQFYNLMQNLTAVENVELAAQICKNALDPKSVMIDVGLEHRLNNFPSQLSGGEQQRVSIARALAKNPKLLLCDEPTGALDSNTGKEILRLLQSACRQKGMTVIVITHNTALQPMADRIIRINSGKVSDMYINKDVVPIERIEW